MKITLKLPNGSELTYEKEPMSEEARADLLGGLTLLCFLGFLLVMFWMFR